MRICFLSNPNLDHTRRWADWFARRGHQVCLIADAPLQAPWPGLELFDLPRRFNLPAVKYLVWIWWTRQILKSWQPDVVHAHRTTGAGWLAAFSGFHPLFVTPWGTDLYQFPHRSPLFHWLTRRVLTAADWVTADSQDLLDLAIHYGAPSEHSHLIQWGVDFDRFSPAVDRPALRRRYGIDAKTLILSPRAIRPIYNQATILQAFSKILRQTTGVRLILRDYHADLEYKNHLQSLVTSLNLQNDVIWVGELPRWDQTVDYYRMSDLVVSIPPHDGTPVSVLEAMACRAAVVAGEVPSLREWIEPGVNGLLVPPGDAVALADALLTLVRNPAMREQFADRSLQIVQARADHQKEMQRMETLYQVALTNLVKP